MGRKNRIRGEMGVHGIDHGFGFGAAETVNKFVCQNHGHHDHRPVCLARDLRAPFVSDPPSRVLVLDLPPAVVEQPRRPFALQAIFPQVRKA